MEAYLDRILRIELPVPFPVRTINAYLVTAEPVTLIDAGVKTEESFRVLGDSLRRSGYGMRDIQRILITHGHIDHYGQAEKIASRSGAEIYIHQKEYRRIQTIAQQRENLVSVLIQNGTPSELLEEAMNSMRLAVQSLAEPLGDVRFVGDGDTIPFDGMELQSILCPGHSTGLVCFYLEDAGILISGDHLLNEISPNPIIDLSETGPGPRSTSLKEYLHSVRKIQNLKVALVLPGHGEPISDFKNALNRIFRHHEERLSTILGILSSGEKTAYEISEAMFPNARSFEVFLGVSEVLGHLRILHEKDKIGFRSRGGVDYYAQK